MVIYIMFSGVLQCGMVVYIVWHGGLLRCLVVYSVWHGILQCGMVVYTGNYIVRPGGKHIVWHSSSHVTDHDHRR